jgi:ABC-type multidrug transport system permease subunit
MAEIKTVFKVLGAFIALIVFAFSICIFLYIFWQYYNGDIDAIKMVVSWFVLCIVSSCIGGFGLFLLDRSDDFY